MLWISLGVLAHGMAPLARAAEPTEAPAPELQVGDRWVYRHVDAWTGNELRTVAHLVTAVAESGYSFESKRSDRDAPSKHKRTRELNTTIKNKDVADNGLLSFPLSVGKSWSSKAYFNNGTDGKGATGLPYVEQCSREVAGVETISVPAGSFAAFKIKARCTQSGDAISGARIEYTYFYAPAARNLVRLDEVSYNSMGGAGNRTRQELIEMSLIGP